MALTNEQTTKSLQDIRISVLDLAPIIEGGTPAEAFQRTRSLAQHTEAWGYHRYWLAEHHNIPGIASSATSVLMGYVAAHTSKIRVGSGGIMLPNHAPLVIAEQFGTLETLYPGRIDLGLGRAPGSDQVTARALRRDVRSGEDFPALLQELRTYFNPALAGPSGFRRVHAIPGEGLNMPIWLLGSSGFSAQLAGELGLPFAFAGQFSPGFILPALSMYRESFKPSEVLQEPYAMVGLNIIAADTDEQARKLATSQQQNFLNLVRGTPGLLKPPVEDMDVIWNEREKYAVDQQLGSSIVGGPASVKEQL
ncbi:MAG TPA: LLM class flavin-dependent oxidoreductase, partial [Paenibacillus sp.]